MNMLISRVLRFNTTKLILNRNNIFRIKNSRFTTENSPKKDEEVKNPTENVENNETDNFDPEDFTMNKLSMEKLDKYHSIMEKFIDNNAFTIKKEPVKNYFGEIPLYLTPNEAFQTRRNCELSGAFLMTGVSFLNYLGLLFSPTLFPYFTLVASVAILKQFAFEGQRAQAVVTTLTEDNRVKITYLNGQEEIYEIKDFQHLNVDRLNKLMDIQNKPQNPKNSTDDKNFTLKDKLIILSFIVKQKKGIFVLRTFAMNPKTKTTMTIHAFADLPLIVGLLNKKTKKIQIL